MSSKLRLGSLSGLDVRLPRTRALLLGLLLAVVGLQPPRSCCMAEVEIDALGEMWAEGGQAKRVGRGPELEASMHSSFLQDVTEAVGAMDAVAIETAGTRRQNVVAPAATFPDSSAVVGRIFQMKVPNKMEDVYLGDIVKVRFFILPECYVAYYSFSHFSFLPTKSGTKQGQCNTEWSESRQLLVKTES